MRLATYALALFVVAGILGTTSVASAADDAPAPAKKAAKVLHGLIKKVDGKTITLTVGKGDKQKDVTVETDDSTQFTIDHEAAKLEDLKEGEVAAVAPAKGTAEHIDVNTSHKDKKPTTAPAEGEAK